MKSIPRNALLLGLLFTPLAYCVVAASPAPDAPVDQVVIEASRTKLAKLEKEVLQSEQRFYERYNALNTKRDYAVHCYNEAETGSRFKKTYCQPVFASKAQEEQARRIMTYLSSSATPATTASAAAGMHGGATGGMAGVAGGLDGAGDGSGTSASSSMTGAPAVMAVEGSQSDFQKNVSEVTRKSPELTKLLNEHAALVKEYEATFRKVNGLVVQPEDTAAAPAAPSSPQAPASPQ